MLGVARLEGVAMGWGRGLVGAGVGWVLGEECLRLGAWVDTGDGGLEGSGLAWGPGARGWGVGARGGALGLGA